VTEKLEKMKEEFEKLSEDEKMEFCMSVMPSMCEAMSKNQDKMMAMMKNMMPYCMEMMQKGSINMQKVMEMMQQVGKGGS